MDFVIRLPQTSQGLDTVWVVVDRFTKSAYFLSIRINYSTERLAQVYIREIVKLHGVPESIVSDRDPRFQSRFWRSMSKAMGTKLQLSTAPPNGWTVREDHSNIGRYVENLCVRFWGKLGQLFTLVEFAYNNSYQSTIVGPKAHHSSFDDDQLM